MDREEARKELHKLNAKMMREELEQEHRCQCSCHKKQKRKDKYKDIIEYIKLYTQAYYKYMQPNITIEEMKPLNDALDKWLEEEV